MALQQAESLAEVYIVAAEYSGAGSAAWDCPVLHPAGLLIGARTVVLALAAESQDMSGGSYCAIDVYPIVALRFAFRPQRLFQASLLRARPRSRGCTARRQQCASQQQALRTLLQAARPHNTLSSLDPRDT